MNAISTAHMCGQTLTACTHACVPACFECAMLMQTSYLCSADAIHIGWELRLVAHTSAANAV
eukprot:1156408-Pelagomonas_calceolata.AAC.4